MRSMIVILLLVVPIVGAAQDTTARARDFYQAGTLAYQEQRWESCAHNFEDSFELVHAPELLYNIGVCYQRAGETYHDRAYTNWEKSIFAYRRYIRENELSDEERSSIVRVISILSSSLRAMEESSGDVHPLDAEYYDPVVAPDPDGPPNPDVQGIEDLSVFEEYTSGPSDPGDEEESIPASTLSTEPGFGYKLTVSLAALTVVTTVVASVLGLNARNQYDQCIDSGCDNSRDRIGRFARTTNSLFGAAGALAAATLVTLYLEYRVSF